MMTIQQIIRVGLWYTKRSTVFGHLHNKSRVLEQVRIHLVIAKKVKLSNWIMRVRVFL